VDVYSDERSYGYEYSLEKNPESIFERGRLWSKSQSIWDINREEICGIMDAMTALKALIHHTLTVSISETFSRMDPRSEKCWREAGQNQAPC
jgi:bifunctional pyridoxal-dependent enzyme with beta-cystathionase and maltose regulon repressor activities